MVYFHVVTTKIIVYYDENEDMRDKTAFYLQWTLYLAYLT